MTSHEHLLLKQSSEAPRLKRFREQRLVVSISCAAYFLSLAYSLSIGNEFSLFLPGLVLMCFGVYAFLLNGGTTIVATSAISYAIVLFIGFPAVYTSLGYYWPGQVDSHESLLVVVTLGFLLQVTALIATPLKVRADNSSLNAHPASDMSKGWLGLSVILLILAVISGIINVPALPSALGWLAILFAAVVAFDVRSKRVRPIGVFVLIAAGFTQMEIVYGGFGRLNLAVMAMSVAMVLTIALRTWWVKIAALAITGPALIYLANQRLRFLREDVGRAASDSEGIASVVGPLHSAGAIAEALLDGRLDLAWGSTLVVAALVWIPRAVWTGKPDGFGREMVEVTQPSMMSTGIFSDAATLVGEGLWNFGVWGALILFIFVVLISRPLDKFLLESSKAAPDAQGVVRIIVIIVLSASMLNIVWGGFFTATSRIFLVIALLLAWLLIIHIRSALIRRTAPVAIHAS